MQDERYTPLSDLAVNLRMLRRMCGKSRRVLAEITGIPDVELAAIECGSVPVTHRTLRTLGRALGVQENVLLAEPAQVARFVAWAKGRPDEGYSQGK